MLDTVTRIEFGYYYFDLAGWYYIWEKDRYNGKSSDNLEKIKEIKLKLIQKDIKRNVHNVEIENNFVIWTWNYFESSYQMFQ